MCNFIKHLNFIRELNSLYLKFKIYVYKTNLFRKLFIHVNKIDIYIN